MIDIAAGLLAVHSVYWFLGAWRLMHPVPMCVGALTVFAAVGMYQNRTWARRTAATLAIVIPAVWVSYSVGLVTRGWLMRIPGIQIGSTIALYAQALVPTALAIGACLLWPQRQLATSSGTEPPIRGHAARQLSRVFVACAAVAETWMYLRFSAATGRSVGVAAVFGIIESAVPLVLATFVCAAIGYLQVPRPRSLGQLAALVSVVLPGILLLIPVVLFLRTIWSEHAQ